MTVTNKELFEEITQVKTILIGDGTPESMEDSIQYRLKQVEVTTKPKARKPDGNGGHIERRTKKTLWSQFKETPLSKKVPIIVVGFPFLGGYWDWLLDFSHKVINWLQSLT